MRRKLPLLLTAAFVAFAAAACEGPAGPQGEQGIQGPQGLPGENALNTCSDCHSSDATIVAIEQQMALSAHGFGNFEVRGPDYSGGTCAGCHTSQGFVAAASGEAADWTGGAASMTCRTCHEIHTDFEGPEDYALTRTEPVTLRLTGNEFDFSGGAADAAGANLCAACHEGRIRDPWPTTTTFGEGTFSITSGHFGPHYSTQANVVSTQIGFEFGDADETTGMFGPHSELGCNGCHMATEGFTPTPGGEGFHNWQPSPTTCNSCHDGDDVGTDFNYDGEPQAIYDVLAAVGTCLENVGIISIEGTPPAPSSSVAWLHGGDVYDYHPNTGDYDEATVAAFITWAALVDDGSWGVHQPRYAMDQAEGMLSFLQTNYPVACPAL